jgi:hypothetical protein
MRQGSLSPTTYQTTDGGTLRTRSSGSCGGTQIDLIPDPSGDYEVQRCERQSYLSGDPQLTVELRKLER